MPAPDTLESWLAAQILSKRPTPPDSALVDDLLAFARRYARTRNPKWTATFEHLRPLAERLVQAYRCFRDRVRTGGIKLVSHAAVQHGKTTLLQAFVLWCLWRDPTIRLGYGAFNNDRAQDKMWQARECAERLGIRLNPRRATREKWYTTGGGFVYAGGLIGGSWTGEGFDIMLVDDAYKGDEEADSPAHRNKIERIVDDVLLTRGQDWTSWILNMARWNLQDISAFLIRRGWPYLCLPAIDSEGRALWPEVVSLEKLLLLKNGDPERGILPTHPRTWAALYQGNPQPDDARIFDPSHLAFYDESDLPKGPWIEAMGLDIAYGAKQQHDRSAYTVFRRYASEPRRLYRVECHSAQLPIELYAMRVAECQLRRGGLVRPLPLPRDLRQAEQWIDLMRLPDVRDAWRIPARWYTSSTEKGAADLLPPWGARVVGVPCGVHGKLPRARGAFAPSGAGGYTSAWAEGRIVVPAQEDQHGQRWRLAHEAFTGLEGCEDDEVDGAVAAYDQLAVPQLGGGGGGGRVLSLGGDRSRAG